MAGHRFSIHSIRRSFLRILGPFAAAIALVACLSLECLGGSSDASAQVAGGKDATPQYGPPSSGATAALQFTPATVNQIAGLINQTALGDGGPATAAALQNPMGVAYDSNGNLYIADEEHFAVRKIDTSGIITTVAGTDTAASGYSTTPPPANTPATSFAIGHPNGLAIDSNNNLYFSDLIFNVVYRVDAVTKYITVYAGTFGASSGYTGDGGLATAAKLASPYGLAFDASNNLYIADEANNVVRVVYASTGKIATFAGTGVDAGVLGGCPTTTYNTSFNGGLATAANLCRPVGVAVDPAGNVYISQLDYNIVNVVGTNGDINAFAGTGTNTSYGYTGDGGPATSAELYKPYGLYVSPSGDLYIADQSGEAIREVDAAGIIHTVYGGSCCGSGYFRIGIIGLPDTEAMVVGGVALSPVDAAYFITMDPYGTLVVSNSGGWAITSAGSAGQYVFPNQQVDTTSSAYSVSLSNPSGVVLNFSGTPVITGPFAISGGTCNFAGSLAAGATCTVGITFTPTADETYPGSIVIGGNVSGSSSTITLSGTGTGTPPAAPIAGLNPSPLNFTNTTAGAMSPATVTVSDTGNAVMNLSNIYISATGANVGIFTIGSSGTCTSTSTIQPSGSCTVVVDFSPTSATSYTATLYVYDNAANSPQTVTLNGTGTSASAPAVSISPSSYVFPATTAQSGYQSGNGNPAITLTNIGNAPLTFTGSTPFTIINGGTSSPISVYPNGSCTETYVNFSTSMPANDNCTITVQFWPQSAGAFQATLSVADNASNSPQTVLLSGIGKAGQLQFAPALLTFIAGSYGNAGTPTSGNNANASLIQAGRGIATDTLGNVYFSDTTNNTVWEVTKTTGKISTFAGAPGVGSYSGDGHAAASAGLNSPMQMAFDGAGNLYIADRLNNVVRMINSSGNISTFAGQQGVGSYSGDGGPATSAKLSGPQGVAVDALGNVYIADTGNNIVRKVDTTGNITLFAGTPDHSGVTVAGAATSVLLGSPYQLATDLAGNVFIADFGNSVVSVVNPTGNISIYAGGGSSAVTTTPQPATSASFFVADGVATDPAGDLYIADQHKIYRVDTSQNITLVAGGGTYTNNGQPATSTAVGATAVAVDPSGNLFAQDTNGYVVYEVGPQGALVFGSQAENTTSAVQTVTLINTGNATAYFYNPNQSSAVPGAPSRAAATAGASSGAAHPESGTGSGSSVYSVTGDFAIASGGTCDFSSIAAGASCTINVTFSPTQTGTRTGNITLYADGPYTIPAVINLSGTGTGAALTAQTINFTQPTTPVTYASGLTIPLVATGGASGNSVTFSIDGSSTGAGSINGSTLNVTGVGTFVIDANQAGNSTYSAATQVQKSVVVTQAAQAINFTPPATPVTYSSGLTISLSATGGASGNSIVFTIDTSSTGTGSITGSTLTVTGVGTFVIDANQAGNSNYAAATQVQKSVVVTQAAQAINFTQPTTPVTYSSGLTIPLVATGGASGNSIVFTIDTSSTGTGSITGGSTLNVTGVGTFVINANQAGNSNYAAATQVQKSIVVNAPPLPTFNVTSPTPPQTVQPGGAAIYTINVNPVNGSYTGAVTLSASGLPTGATAGFSPNPVTPGSAGAPSTMTIQTAALTASAKSSSWPLAAPVLSLIGLFFVPGKRRRRWLTLAVLLIASLGALTALSACGGGFQLPSHESPPLTITVNGANASGAIVSSTTVQLTVQ